MRYYIELTLLPNPEIDLYFLWSKVFQQVHLGLVERQDEQNQSMIGVTFPEYKQEARFATLGSKLRLFSPSQTELEAFDVRRWLDKLTDYVHITSIRSVPEKVTNYVACQRIQPKTGKDRLVKRFIKRHQDMTQEQALVHYEVFVDEQLTLPFIQLQSLSSGHQFRIWIQQRIVAVAREGKFSCYGLSADTALPHF
jgi:CRISPR-associated endonuclease Csy4